MALRYINLGGGDVKIVYSNEQGEAVISGEFKDNILFIGEMDSFPPRRGIGEEMLRHLPYKMIVISSSSEASGFWKKMIEKDVIIDVLKKRGFLLGMPDRHGLSPRAVKRLYPM